jgi:tetratricopeptide (TPR) repeat protein
MVAGVLLSFLLAFPALQVTGQNENPLELNPAIRHFLDTRVEKDLPPMQRLESLANAVFRDRELGFSYSSASRTAIETFENRNGNCLSFTLLLIAMARHLNLDARFREVEVPPIFTKTGEFVNLSQHLNAAVKVGSATYAIDVFPGVVPIEIGGRIVSDERGLAHFFNNKGVDELSGGDFAQAETYLQKALEIDPTMVGAWINWGAICARTGKLAEAERHYRKALELDPQDLAAMNNLANVCEQTGKTKEAAILQKKVKEFREKNPYHHYNLGMQAFKEGNYEQALIHYKRAIKLKSTEHNFYFAIAQAYARIGQNREVQANLRLAERYANDAENKQKYAQKLELLKNLQQPETLQR